MQPTVCGLDFGTSNSTIGIWQGGKPTLVALEDGKPTLPSAMFFHTEENRTEMGRAAIQAYTEGAHGRLMRALKSVLGSSLIHETTRIKHRTLAFTEIIGLFLAHLKAQAERQAGAEITHVVMGRPVFFVDDNPAADREAQNQLEAAARAQGFREVMFQYEPIAAALDYEQQVRAEQLALIIDIGGGTADFAVVRVSPTRAQQADRKADILASQGVHIGGTDIDRLLSLAEVMPLLGKGTRMRARPLEVPQRYYHELATWHRINGLFTPQTRLELRQITAEAAEPERLERLRAVVENRLGHALAGQVEEAKIRLTDELATSLHLALPHEMLAVPLTRTALNAAIAEATEQVVATAAHTVQQAGVSPGQIQALFLTGGSTAIPVIQQRMVALYPTAQVVQGDTFGSVGLGLTLSAHRHWG